MASNQNWVKPKNHSMIGTFISDDEMIKEELDALILDGT